MHIRFLTLLILYTFPFFLIAQDSVMVENRQLSDVFRKNKVNLNTSLVMELDKNYISVLPVVGYAPANGFVIGAAISFSRLFDPVPTNVSAGMLNVQVTSKQQFILNARSKIYLQENKWFLQGDWRFLLFAQPTYGLGIHPVSFTENTFPIGLNGGDQGTTNAQDMRYNYFRLYEDVVRQMGDGHWYIGAGIAFDQHYSIDDKALNLDSTNGKPAKYTDHYVYSQQRGFDPKTYITNGFNFNVLTDTRDNVANPYKGYYFGVSYRINPKIFYSTQQSSMISYDARYYLNLQRSKPRHIIAIWSNGQFVLNGNMPYLALPSIGWDTYNRSGRGYIQGRFRGLSMMYAEMEYRFPLSKSGLLGGVVFVNGTTAKSDTQKMFDIVAPAGGLGLRVKMDKVARVNLTIDYGIGYYSQGIYFNLQETF